jgi:DNA-binding NarL/FixJ family response regulator
VTAPYAVRVLLVEDHPLVRGPIRRALGDLGFNVVATAADGPSCVELYSEHRPDVVLSDVVLPGYSGIEATRRVLAADPTARVLLMSAAAVDSAIAAGIAAGAVGYVLKTVDATELYVYLLEAYDGRRDIFDRATAERVRALSAE